MSNDKRALTLGDIKVENLKDGKPLYISNVVANHWRKEYKRNYCLLTMSPKGIEKYLIIASYRLIAGVPDLIGEFQFSPAVHFRYSIMLDRHIKVLL